MWKKVCLARRMTRLAGSPFCEGRVTLLAEPPFLYTNTLACPAGSTRSRWDNQSMCEHYWLGKGVNHFFRWLRGRVTVFFGTTFLHMNGTQRDEIKLQCSVWFESINWLVLVSAVKEYFCVHILKFDIVWVSDWTGGISWAGRAHDFRAGGHGLDPRGRTTTQSLKITEKWK